MVTRRSDEMLKYVENYYRESRYYIAQNNAKGQEFDIIHAIIEDLLKQFNPQTCTWSIKMWEEFLGISARGNLDNRRMDINRKILLDGRSTPITLENLIRKLFSIKVHVIRNVSAYTFKIIIEASEKSLNLHELRKTIEDFKEAHMAYQLLEQYNSKVNIDIRYITIFALKTAFFPRANIPYLKYDGTAQYNGTVRYDKYKTNERIQLYPIRLGIRSDTRHRIFFYPQMICKNLFTTPIHFENKIGCRNEINAPPKMESKLAITKENTILPNYQIRLKIGKHPNRYDGTCQYNGNSRYYVEKKEIL